MINYKYLFLVPLIVAGAGYSRNRTRSCDIAIINSRNIPVPISVEIADTEELRETGLMNRRELRPGLGMLFVFQTERRYNFWMKDTYIPLSIAYIGKNGLINEIYDMKPLDTTVTYPAKTPALYALEVTQGWFRNNNITRGCRIKFNGCFGKQNSLIKR